MVEEDVKGGGTGTDIPPCSAVVGSPPNRENGGKGDLTALISGTASDISRTEHYLVWYVVHMLF